MPQHFSDVFSLSYLSKQSTLLFLEILFFHVNAIRNNLKKKEIVFYDYINGRLSGNSLVPRTKNTDEIWIMWQPPDKIFFSPCTNELSYIWAISFAHLFFLIYTISDYLYYCNIKILTVDFNFKKKIQKFPQYTGIFSPKTLNPSFGPQFKSLGFFTLNQRLLILSLIIAL